jgi:hypothetical protein
MRLHAQPSLNTPSIPVGPIDKRTNDGPLWAMGRKGRPVHMFWWVVGLEISPNDSLKLWQIRGSKRA